MNDISHELLKKDIVRKSLKIYLTQIKDTRARDAVVEKFKRLLSIKSSIDSQPVDAYRMLGRTMVQIQLVEELNSFIMEHATHFSYYVKTWTKELWDLRKLYKEQQDSSTEMCRALIFQGHLDGLYTPEQTSTEKEALP